jgi:mono/diheme cytochrome c family protein
MLSTLTLAATPGLIDAITGLAGRLHPLLVHLPIGTVVALGACELLAMLRGKPLDMGVRLLLAALTGLSAVASAGAGWLLAGEASYAPSQTLTLHRWLGVSVAGLATLTLIAAVAKTPRTYLGLLGAMLVMIGPAGHFGAVLTHGSGYLTEPFRAAGPVRTILTPVQIGPVEDEASRIDPRVAAIFASHCVSCHGESRQRGGLALHRAEAIFAGGDHGPAVAPGDPDASEIVIRLRLPLDDGHHMPPQSRPQTTEAEIDAVVRWIAGGAGGARP